MPTTQHLDSRERVQQPKARGNHRVRRFPRLPLAHRRVTPGATPGDGARARHGDTARGVADRAGGAGARAVGAGVVTPAERRDYDRARHARNVAEGRCGCGRPRDHKDRKQCERCREDSRAYNERGRARA